MKGNPPGSPFYGPSIQVGGFVKALVLISPEWSYKGMLAKHGPEQPGGRQPRRC